MSFAVPIAYAPERWEPGDPLFARQGHQHSLYFYNFRDDDPCRDNETDCVCPDRATWPEPMPGTRELSEDDDVHLWPEFRRADA